MPLVPLDLTDKFVQEFQQVSSRNEFLLKQTEVLGQSKSNVAAPDNTALQEMKAALANALAGQKDTKQMLADAQYRSDQLQVRERQLADQIDLLEMQLRKTKNDLADAAQRVVEKPISHEDHALIGENKRLKDELIGLREKVARLPKDFEQMVVDYPRSKVEILSLREKLEELGAENCRLHREQVRSEL